MKTFLYTFFWIGEIDTESVTICAENREEADEDFWCRYENVCQSLVNIQEIQKGT